MKALDGILPASLFVGVILAACVGGSAAKIDPPSQSAAYDDESGSVVGQIIDESLLPIENAVASLLAPNGTAVYLFARSDASGRFALNFIPPGEYKVEIKATGYEVETRDIQLAAGEIEELVFRMVAGFADVAYYVTDHLSRMIGGGTVKYGFECSTTPWYSIVPSDLQSLLGKYCVGGNFCRSEVGCSDVSSGCQGSYSKDSKTTNEYGDPGYVGGYRDLLMNDTDWTTQLAELTWQPSSAVSGRGVLFEILGPNVTNNANGERNNRCGGINQSDPRDFLVLSDKPPVRLEINHALIEARNIPVEDHCCDWRWRLFPGWCDLGNCARWGPDANVLGLVAPTRVEIYYTIFFREAPPPGWSTLEDN